MRGLTGYCISPFSILQHTHALGNGQAASAAWPLADVALFVPFFLPQRVVIYEVATGTGATAGGNFAIGVYTMSGTLIQDTDEQARTASAWNRVDWTDLTLDPGWYYMAMSADSTNNYSGTVPVAGICEAFGICEMTSAHNADGAGTGLPATATLSRTTRAFVPAIGLFAYSVAS
jgi:hypothetical protein